MRKSAITHVSRRLSLKTGLTRYSTFPISKDVHLEDMWRFLLWRYPLFQEVNTIQDFDSCDGYPIIHM